MIGLVIQSNVHEVKCNTKIFSLSMVTTIIWWALRNH